MCLDSANGPCRARDAGLAPKPSTGTPVHGLYPSRPARLTPLRDRPLFFWIGRVCRVKTSQVRVRPIFGTLTQVSTSLLWPTQSAHIAVLPCTLVHTRPFFFFLNGLVHTRFCRENARVESFTPQSPKG